MIKREDSGNPVIWLFKQKIKKPLMEIPGMVVLILTIYPDIRHGFKWCQHLLIPKLQIKFLASRGFLEKQNKEGPKQVKVSDIDISIHANVKQFANKWRKI